VFVLEPSPWKGVAGVEDARRRRRHGIQVDDVVIGQDDGNVVCGQRYGVVHGDEPSVVYAFRTDDRVMHRDVAPRPDNRPTTSHAGDSRPSQTFALYATPTMRTREL
jgi:hypothetical protein